MNPWCKGCGARIEWHPRQDGKTVAIDPDPTPDGPLAFGPGMKLGPATIASRRRYRYHISACPKPDAAMRKSASTCDREDCERTDSHRHCFSCGGTDHFAADCPDA